MSKEKKIGIYNLIIEVTRRCNMECEHCLRGDSQNIDIDLDYIDKLFSKLNYISTLTISGGEPSLVPEIISNISNLLNKYNIEIGSFYMATNGKLITKEFLMSCIELYTNCMDDDNMTVIELSNDEYHEDIDSKNEKLLRGLSFFKRKYPDTDIYYYDYRQIVKDGRADYNGIGEKIVDTNIKYEFDEYDDNILITEGEIHLNCLGNIICNCDLSYKSQNDINNIVCHVNDFSIERLIDFNNKESLSEATN